MIAAPPSGHPPIVLDVDYARLAAAEHPQLGGQVALRDGRLHMTAAAPETDHGFAVSDRSYRDVVLQARLSLTEGGDDDYYGIFLRQAEPGLYYVFALSPAGAVWIRFCDGGAYREIAHAQLAPDLPFHRGVGQANVFQVVACGPCLTLVLNQRVITGLLVDARCKDGFLGFYLHQGATSQRAALAADWIQARGMFPA